MRLTSGEIVARIPLDRIAPDFGRAEVRFEGLRPPLSSYEARLFLDEPCPNAQTPTEGNPHYLGSQFFYGLGAGDTRSDSGSPYSLEGPTQSSRRQLRLNVTERLRAYLRQTAALPASLSLVAVDHDGREIAEPDLDVDGITLVTV